MRPPVVVVGDALLDRDLVGVSERLCPDAPAPVVEHRGERARPGGAGLAALLAARDGHAVTLVTALGDDEAGRTVRGLLEDAGVRVADLGMDGATPEKVRVCAGDRPLVRVDRGGAPGPVGPPDAVAAAALAGAAAVLVADYGRGVAAQPGVREALAAAARRRPVVWDPHPRGAAPVPGVRLFTPSHGEARRLAPEVDGDGPVAAARRARAIAERMDVGGVLVTLGAEGAVYAEGARPPMAVPTRAVARADAVGAGDRLAAAATVLLARGALAIEAVAGAVEAATLFVAAGGVAAALADPRDLPAPGRGAGAEAVMSRARARGERVVAAGGCFDLLHAGHVRMLEAARRLGDHLVVLLNSDASVRRLKGPDRPIVPQQDRAAVLAALSCVDAVEVFDEDSPVAALERLRPDVFAKGGDYALEDLPEAEVVRGWGGEAVVLPYVAGRSTTRLIQEVQHRVVR